jgi:molybdopterin molybdotransferase
MPDYPPRGLSNQDVRMRGFAHRATLEECLTWLDDQISPLAATELAIPQAAGRVLAEDIICEINVPGFRRAMMDGYAVVATDTSGATTYNRLSLEIIGHAFPGQEFKSKIEIGQCVRIMTGSPLPAGSDAVLPAEQTEVEGNRIWIQADVSPKKHVANVGEDISEGTCVFRAGRQLRPQDVGVLSSIGRANVSVVRKPRVRIVVTGDELLPTGSVPTGCQITDANSPMLDALCCRDGALVHNPGIVPDDPTAIRTALHDEADVILVSGGSSVGQEDHAPVLLAEDGELAIHGIAIRPSSPAGMGRLGQRLVFLLPGNPVSCLCAYDFFAGRAIRVLGGRERAWPYPTIRLPLSRKLVSTIGRVDYARVMIVDNQVEPLAISGASVLSSTTRADGFVVVPANSEGYAPASEVDVFLYDGARALKSETAFRTDDS